MDGQDVELALLQAAEHTEARSQTATALLSIREVHGNIHLQMECKGLPDDIDMAWEPLEQVLEDIPVVPWIVHLSGLSPAPWRRCNAAIDGMSLLMAVTRIPLCRVIRQLSLPRAVVSV